MAEKATLSEKFKQHLKDTKKNHFDFCDPFDYKVTTSSLSLDEATNGGFGSGIHRFVGNNNSGKTHFALSIIRNFFEEHGPKNCYALYIDAEGRLVKDIKERSKLKFAEETIEPGKVYVHSSNMYEHIIALIEKLLVENDDKRLIFVLDSLDAVCTEDSMDKEITQNAKIAGVPSLTKRFFQRLALKIARHGHMFLLISQVSSAIEGAYTKNEDRKEINVSGGNAALHFSNWILYFMPRMNKNNIYDGDKKVIGHHCEVKIIKATGTESKGKSVTFPINHAAAGNAIWREREVTEKLIEWRFVTQEKAWFNSDQSFLDQIDKIGEKAPERFHGEEKIVTYLSGNNKVCMYWYDYFKNLKEENISI